MARGSWFGAAKGVLRVSIKATFKRGSNEQREGKSQEERRDLAFTTPERILLRGRKKNCVRRDVGERTTTQLLMGE